MSKMQALAGRQDKAEADVQGFKDNLGPFVVAAETSRMPMVFTDATQANNSIIFANDSFISLFGYQRDEVLGQGFNVILANATDTEQLAAITAEFEEGLSRGPEICCRRRDGGTFWAGVYISPVRDQSGAIVQHFASFVDLTRQKAAGLALSEVNAELVRVARIITLSVFGASIAHEINQPLAALTVNNETALLWMSKNPPNLSMAESAIKRSMDNAHRASEIIARMQSLVTRGPSKVVEFDVNDAIREVFAITAAERQRAKVTVTADLTPGPLTISGDRIQVQQVLLNLIGNAIEAMRDAPEQERRLFIRSGLVEHDQVQVEIEDRGPGLDPETAHQIFDHLFTTKTGGTGLGLSISRSIVESHGGRIWAEPANPNGAVFRFQIAH
jgi:two-component system, LuxR family, sensor kinase FixL